MELREKEERLRLLAQENAGCRQEILSMVKQLEDRDEEVRLLKQEVDNERRRAELAVTEANDERLIGTTERIRELESQLQTSLEASYAQVTNATTLAGEREQQLRELQRQYVMLEDVLGTKEKELDDLSSSRIGIEDTNLALRQRVGRLNVVRSRLESLFNQANMRAALLKRQLDLNVSLSFLFLFFLVLFCFMSLFLNRLHDFLVAQTAPPTRTCSI